MIIWIAKRFLQMLPVLWGIVTVVFLLLHIVPGDPVDILLGENALQANREMMRAKLHLDQPLLTQYFSFWRGLFKGDLGESLSQQVPVTALVLSRIPATLELAVLSMAIAACISIPIGTWLSTKRNTFSERAILMVSLIGVSIPTFWLGPLLVLFFSVHLGWFPVSERGDFSSYVLPTATLALSLSAYLLRITRASTLEVIHENYITTAKSKGLSSIIVYGKHALKNALLPVVSVLGLQLGSLMSGAIIIESIFDWPGIGELLRNAILARDFTLVQGCVLAIAFSYLILNIMVDIAYTWINPKVRV
jgi:ABC-type dipeptide/oligopeptide/nickel transport system permease component